MNIEYLLPPAIVALVATVLLVAMVWLQRQPTPAHRTFRLILASTIAWGLVIFLMRSSPDTERALVWDRLIPAIMAINYCLFYLFSLRLTGSAGSWLLHFSYGVTALAIALTPTDLVIRDMEVIYYGYAPVIGPAAYIFLPFAFLSVGAAVLRLIRAQGSTRNREEKNRLLYLIAAMAFPFVGGVVEILPMVYPTAIFGNLMFCLITSVAILKYHLLDIRIVIRKGLAYAMCTGLGMAAYTLLLLLMYVFTTHSWQPPFWLNAGFIVGFTVAFHPLLRRTQDWVDRAFDRERYDYLRALERVVEETRQSLDLTSITSSFLSAVTSAMRCRKATLLLPGTSGKYFALAASHGVEASDPIRIDLDSVLVQWLAQHENILTRKDMEVIPQFQALTAKETRMMKEIEGEVFIPLKTRGGLRGMVILGQKVSEQDYSLEEVSVLRVVSRQMATALENARLYVSDKLTGLYNRAFFEDEMRRLDVSRQLPLSIIMGDVNGLKVVNDALGHDVGDRLLCMLAKLMKRNCRKEDIVARWGGDEFVILLPKTSDKVAREISARIRRGCLEMRGTPISLNIALGTATKDAQDQDILDVLREAEDRMYRNKLMERNSARHAIISSLEQSLWETTHETEEHAGRMQELALPMGRALGLSDNQLDELALLAALHDIGKIAIAKTILTKPGKLSPDEWAIMKKHPEIGYRIAMACQDLIPIAEPILAHHERWDGAGYPQGLRGENIPLVSRIISVIDAYDVITNGRVYQEAASVTEAIDELHRCAGTQFDPTLVDMFAEMLCKMTEHGEMLP